MNISDLRLPARQAKASAGPQRGSFDLPFFVLTLLLLTIGVITCRPRLVRFASFPSDITPHVRRHRRQFACHF